MLTVEGRDRQQSLLVVVRICRWRSRIEAQSTVHSLSMDRKELGSGPVPGAEMVHELLEHAMDSSPEGVQSCWRSWSESSGSRP